MREPVLEELILKILSVGKATTLFRSLFRKNRKDPLRSFNWHLLSIPAAEEIQENALVPKTNTEAQEGFKCKI